jgi:uncharacterized protein
MPTTSSPTSAEPSTDSSPRAIAAWSVLALVLVAFAFAATSFGTSDREVFYEYSLATTAIVQYGILVALTFAIAAWLKRPLPMLGLKGFAWRWVAIAVGLMVLVLLLASALEPLLHAGEKQGLGPETWRPERAGAFALNACVAATIVPIGEELFFRGLGVRLFIPFGGLAAVGVTALVFGLAHGLFSALAVLIPFGLALGWVRLRSDSVLPGTLAHGFYNGAALFYLYLDLTNRV